MGPATRRGARPERRDGEARQTQTRRLKAAAELAALAAAAGTIADVYRHAADRAAKLLDADFATIRIYEKSTRHLALVASSGAAKHKAPSLAESAQRLASKAFRTGRPVRTHHLEVTLPAGSPADELRDRAGVAVPVRVGRRIAGTIAAIGKPGVRYTSDDTAVLDLFGRVIGAALERVAALTAAERRAKRLETLHEVALTLAGSHDPAKVLDLVVTRARQLLGADRATVRLWDRDRNLLTIAAVDGDVGTPPVDPVRPSEGAVGRAFATRKPVVVDDYPTWNGSIPAVATSGQRSLVAVPLQLRGQRLGVLAVTTRDRHAFQAEDAQLLTLFAQQATVSFVQARTVAEERTSAEHARRLATLHLLSVDVVQQTDEQQVLQRTVLSAARLLHGQIAHLWLYDPESDEIVLRVSHGQPAHHEAERLPLQARPLVAETVRRRAVVVAEDYAGLPDAVPHLVAGGIVSAIATPLLSGWDVLGVLSVLSAERRTWTAADQQVLAILAHHATQAMLNARRIAATQQAARLDAALRLARDASHRISNPLTVTMGSLDVLLHAGELPARERRMVEAALGGLRAAVDAVQDLQQAARTAAGEA